MLNNPDIRDIVFLNTTDDSETSKNTSKEQLDNSKSNEKFEENKDSNNLLTQGTRSFLSFL